MEIIKQTCGVLDTLVEEKVAFNDLLKNEKLLSDIEKEIGDRKLKTSDKRIEGELGNVLLADVISAVIYRDRADFKGEQTDFEIRGSDLVDGDDVVVMHALGGDYTLSELVVIADAYAFRKQRFKVTASPIESRGDKLAGVEQGTEVVITINNLRKITFQLYPSEVQKLINALK